MVGEAHAARPRGLHDPDFSLPGLCSQLEAVAGAAGELSEIVRDLAALTDDQ